jgi:hypothetical protein
LYKGRLSMLKGLGSYTPPTNTHSVALSWAQSKDVTYDYTPNNDLTANLKATINNKTGVVGGWLSQAYDTYTGLLGLKGQPVEDVIATLTGSCDCTFQAVGSCADLRSSKINDPDHNFDDSTSGSQIRVFGRWIETDQVIIKCGCPGVEQPIPGQKLSRLFKIKWYLQANLKVINVRYLVQTDDITVTAPMGCCCPGGESGPFV